jgi:GT2 family glycosyltransferase
MDISFVLAVYNKLDLTKACYQHLRKLYPDTPLVISSGGSFDGTKEWLESLTDENLSFIHDDDRLTFSDTYNAAIKLVDTEKLVLIHNDMVIGNHFIENLNKFLTPDVLLTYTTVEPPIFAGHKRPGKVIADFGSSFHNFNHPLFEAYVEANKDNHTVYDGAAFFMAGYKKMFEDVGFFDGFTFAPVFCEDDDFLLRARLKGYKLRTIECAIVYHFVSQTSRFSEEMKNERVMYEYCSQRNFIRKWGMPFQAFLEQRYWEDDSFNYKTFTMGLTTRNKGRLFELEPYFDKIDLGQVPDEYVSNEQKNTNYDLRSKFLMPDMVDVMIYEINPLTDQDIHILYNLRLSIPYYEPGEYELGNMKIEIRRGIA